VYPFSVLLFHNIVSLRNEGLTIKTIETLLDKLVNTMELYL
jgi:hypothetical protein